MEILVSLGLVIAGGVIGFFVAKYWFSRGPSKESIAQAEQDLKAVLSQQSEHHIYQSKQLVKTIEKQCTELTQQIEAYEGLLGPENANDGDPVPFYGEHASTYLRNQLSNDEKPTDSGTADTQPRDFAAAGSGLFTDQSKTVIEQADGTKSET